MDEADEEDIELYEVSLAPDEGGAASDSQDDGFGQAATEGINTDEFEHIAEIYDQIRMLHQQLLFSERSNQQVKTMIDRNLASYFDQKLKKVMEELALCQNNPIALPGRDGLDESNRDSEAAQALQNNLKREMSQRSVYQLYMVCAEKITGLALRETQDIANVIVPIFKGLAKIQSQYKRMVVSLSTRNAKLQEDLERNQLETQQVLEAAEHLEQSNASNLDKAAKLEASNADLKQRVAELERQSAEQAQTIERLRREAQESQASLSRQQQPEPQAAAKPPSFALQKVNQQNQLLQQHPKHSPNSKVQNQIQGQGQTQIKQHSQLVDLPLQQHQQRSGGSSRPNSAMQSSYNRAGSGAATPKN